MNSLSQNIQKPYSYSSQIVISDNKGEFVIYQTKDGKITLEVNRKEETVWLNQVQMGQLFEKDRRTISEHISNIYKEKELQTSGTIRKFRIVDCKNKRLRSYYEIQGIRNG